MYKATVKVYVDGQELELYTIGHVAKLLKRSVETIRAWERDKTIPRPMYKWRNNVRLYHPLEVDAMKAAIKKAGRNPKKENLRKFMWEMLAATRREIIGEKSS